MRLSWNHFSQEEANTGQFGIRSIYLDLVDDVPHPIHPLLLMLQGLAMHFGNEAPGDEIEFENEPIEIEGNDEAAGGENGNENENENNLNSKDDYAKLNPNREVPALIIDGHVLTQSVAIKEYC